MPREENAKMLADQWEYQIELVVRAALGEVGVDDVAALDPAKRPGVIRLSTSMLSFLAECPRCLYLTVVCGLPRPSSPLPRVFTAIDGLQRGHFHAQSTSELTPDLPAGEIDANDTWVQSEPLQVPGHATRVEFRGTLDALLNFDDGTVGIADFKTTSPNDDHVPRYSRQLHAYAACLENPTPGAVGAGPVVRMGLACMDPVDLRPVGPDQLGLVLETTWLEVERDDGAFLDYLSGLLDFLTRPEPPHSTPKCLTCRYERLVRNR